MKPTTRGTLGAVVTCVAAVVATPAVAADGVPVAVPLEGGPSAAKLPEAGLLAPALQAAPGAGLGLAPGR